MATSSVMARAPLTREDQTTLQAFEALMLSKVPPDDREVVLDALEGYGRTFAQIAHALAERAFVDGQREGAREAFSQALAIFEAAEQDRRRQYRAIDERSQ